MLEERAQERMIGTVNYKVQPIAFGLGLKALNRLIRVLSPIVAAALREGRPMDRAAAVLEVLPANLSDDDLEYFRTVFSTGAWFADDEGNWQPLLKSAKVDNQEVHFAGRYSEWLQWIIFSIEVNYGGFFDGVAAEATPEGSKPQGAGIFATLVATLQGQRTTTSAPTPGSGSSGGS